MADFPTIPAGMGIPLVDMDTYLFPEPTMDALSDTFSGADEVVVNVARYASAQAALDAAPAGATVYFPESVSPVTVPTGGLVLKSQNLTIDARACEFEVSAWGTPAFLALRANSAADDHTFRIGLVTYTGSRGNHTGTIRGGASYTSGCGVYSNGDRNFVEYLRTDGMPTPINFSSWDGSTVFDRMGVGNRVGYLEAEGYDFALLYVKQEAFDWGNGYCHDDIDDSGGVNPTHAIYCSAADGDRAGVGSIGRWVTERNNAGHAYIFKFSDGITAGKLVANDCKGVISVQGCVGVSVDSLIGTELAALASDRHVTVVPAASGTVKSSAIRFGNVSVKLASGVDTFPVGIWADDVEVGSIEVETQHTSGIATANPSVLLRGDTGNVGTIRVTALGTGTFPIHLGDTVQTQKATRWTIPNVRSLGASVAWDAIPVLEPGHSHSNAWGDGGGFLVGAIPTKGIYRRGMRWGASAPSAGAARGWTQTVNGAVSAATWAATTAVAAAVWWKLADGRVIRYLTAGTTGGSEPNPTTIGQTGTDGTATYEYMSATSGTIVSQGNL